MSIVILSLAGDKSMDKKKEFIFHEKKWPQKMPAQSVENKPPYVHNVVAKSGMVAYLGCYNSASLACTDIQTCHRKSIDLILVSN